MWSLALKWEGFIEVSEEHCVHILIPNSSVHFSFNFYPTNKNCLFNLILLFYPFCCAVLQTGLFCECLTHLEVLSLGYSFIYDHFNGSKVICCSLVNKHILSICANVFSHFKYLILFSYVILLSFDRIGERQGRRILLYSNILK